MVVEVLKSTSTLLDKFEVRPETVSVQDNTSIIRAVEMGAEGIPFAFAVSKSTKEATSRIYGLGGSWEAFVPGDDDVVSIQELKSYGSGKKDRIRNFYEKPPVCATSWESLEKVVDWDSICEPLFGVSGDDSRAFVQRLFKEQSAHLILPIRVEAFDKFPFARDLGHGRRGHAFLLGERGVLGDLVEQWEKVAGDKFLLVTSANKTGKPTLGTCREVVETFPELELILADELDMDAERPENTGRSSPMYYLTDFPYTIGVRRMRYGSEHGKMVQYVLDEDLLRFAGTDFGFKNLYKIVNPK